MAESFFQLLKLERIRRRTYPNRDAVKQDVFEYIEMFYNPKRKHTNNGMLPSVDFEIRQQKLSKACVQETRGTSIGCYAHSMGNGLSTCASVRFGFFIYGYDPKYLAGHLGSVKTMAMLWASAKKNNSSYGALRQESEIDYDILPLNPKPIVS